MIARILAPIAVLALCGCEQAPRSLVGDFPAPGIYALAGDTITVWKRIRQPDGAWRFHSYSVTPGGTVEYLEELERLGAPDDPEEAQDFAEQRQGFALPPGEFEAVRSQAALLRPASLGPDDPVGGYGGEAYPPGCPFDKTRPRVAGVNFLNDANWGAFVLQAGCQSEGAKPAAAAMTQLFDRLDRAARQAGKVPR